MLLWVEVKGFAYLKPTQLSITLPIRYLADRYNPNTKDFRSTMSFKYHTPAEYEQIICECELELDAREAARADQDRLARVQAWAQDPRNAAQLAQIRAEFDRIAPQRPAFKSQSPAQAAPRVIGPRDRFHPDDLKRERPTYGRIIDPMCK
jgi:hypothetical protein